MFERKEREKGREKIEVNDLYIVKHIIESPLFSVNNLQLQTDGRVTGLERMRFLFLLF